MRVSACNDIIFLLTMSRRGIPALALSSLELFPLSRAPFQQVPSPNLPYMYLCLCWAWLPAPAATSTDWCCYGLYPAFPHFSGLQEGEKQEGWNDSQRKGLCTVFTLTLCDSHSRLPAAPKQTAQKEVGVSASQMSQQRVVLQNNKET